MAEQKPVLKSGYKYLDPSNPEEGQVLESVQLGKNVRGLDGRYVGPDCVFSDDTSFNYGGIIGAGVYVGKDSRVRAAKVGDLTKIGEGTIIGDRSVIGTKVLIGDNVTIEHDVEVRAGVTIPDGWLIPAYNVVNPGPSGVPVVISTYLPRFQCNVVARNGGY